MTARPSIIPGLFSIFTSDRHQRVLQDKENAVLIGTSIEELIRHHPSLKSAVFAAIKSTLARIEEMGNAYEPPESIRPWYRLSSQAPSSVPTEVPSDGDIAMESVESNLSQQTGPTPPESEPNASADAFSLTRDDTSPRAHDNLIISFIDVFCKVCLSFHDVFQVLTLFSSSWKASSSMRLTAKISSLIMLL